MCVSGASECVHVSVCVQTYQLLFNVRMQLMMCVSY